MIDLEGLNLNELMDLRNEHAKKKKKCVAGAGVALARVHLLEHWAGRHEEMIEDILTAINQKGGFK